MLLYLFYAGFLVAACQAMSGIVEYESIDAKFVCPSAEQKPYKVTSEMQCVQRCLRMYNCSIVNYKIASESSNVEKNCEVYVVNNGKCFKQNGAKGWKAIVFKVCTLSLCVYFIFMCVLYLYLTIKFANNLTYPLQCVCSNEEARSIVGDVCSVLLLRHL